MSEIKSNNATDIEEAIKLQTKEMKRFVDEKPEKGYIYEVSDEATHCRAGQFYRVFGDYYVLRKGVYHISYRTYTKKELAKSGYFFTRREAYAAAIAANKEELEKRCKNEAI